MPGMLELENSDYDAPIVENIKERRQYGTYIPNGESTNALRVDINGEGALGNGGAALVVQPGTGQVQGDEFSIVSGDDRTLDVALPGGNDRRDAVVLTDAGTLEVVDGRGGQLQWGGGVTSSARTYNNAYRPPPPDLQGTPGLVLATVTVRSGTTKLDNDAVDSTVRVGPPLSGEGDVARVGAGDSIQAAVDAADDGGTIEIGKSYEPEVENTPVTVTPSVEITGPGAFSSRIFSFAGQGPYVFEIDAGESGVFRAPMFSDLSISGGGYRLVDGAGVRWENCVVNYGGEHAWSWADDANMKFDCVLVNCHAENVQEDAYHVAGKAHNLQLLACMARRCGGRGIYTSGRPANVTVQGGNLERNGGPNAEINSYSATIESAYIERGDENTANPNRVGVYLGGRQNTIKDCYHQAGNPDDGRADVAVLLDGENCSAENGDFTDYNEGYVRVDGGATDVDIHATTHTSVEGKPVVVSDSGTRTRSGGVIGGAGLGGVDLSATTGQTTGDVALSDGTAGRAFVPAAWTGSTWRTAAADDTVAARVYLSADQSVDSGTPIKTIAMDAATFDTESGFDATNSKYTIPETGLYEITLNLRLLGLSSGSQVQPQIYINGSGALKSANGGEYAEVRGRFDLSSGDSVSWRVFHDEGSALDLRGAENITFGEVERIGSL